MSEELPKVPASHVQSTDSELALRQVIRPPLFLIRGSTPDYGVDFMAEALTDEREATNWHLPIQLRSEGVPRLVDGGTAMSVVFKTSALKYLFRWPGRSIVVAYNASDGLLTWEWTDRIVAALDAHARDWRGQYMVTVRVPTRNVLDGASADAIRREILRYCQRAVAAQEALLVAGRDSSAAERLRNAQDAVEVIRQAGTQLVSAGLHREILDRLKQVPESDWIDDPNVVLTIAFAYERAGSPLQALHFANLVEDDALGSNTDDHALLAHIRADARLAVGQIDFDTHSRELRILTRDFPHSFIAAQAQLQLMAKNVVLASEHKDRRDAIVFKILGQARDLVAQYRESRGERKPTLWPLEILLARVEIEAVDQLLLSGSYRVRLAENLGVPIRVELRQAMAVTIAAVAQVASERLEKVAKEAEAAGERDWVAFCRLTFLESHVKRSGLFLVIGAILPDDAAEKDRSLLEDVVASAEDLAARFAACDYQTLAFRAKRLQAEALAMLGDEEGLTVVKRDLDRRARRLGLHPDTATILEPPRLPSDRTDQRTVAETWVDATPIMLKRLEDDAMHTLGLPESRRPVLVRDIQAIRRSHREKFEFCRHLGVLQNLTHTQRLDTYYARDPARAGHCSRFAYESKIESEDTDAVIAAFKAAYCHDCSVRDPFTR